MFKWAMWIIIGFLIATPLMLFTNALGLTTLTWWICWIPLCLVAVAFIFLLVWLATTKSNPFL